MATVTQLPRKTAYAVVRYTEQEGDTHAMTVLLQTDSLDEARVAFADADPATGRVALLGKDAKILDERTAEPEEDPDTGQLIDADRYLKEGLQIPKVDGQTIDRIAVAVAGEIMLDRSNEADVALYNRLTLGKDVELRVAGKVRGTGAKDATSRDGELDVVIGKKTVKIDSIWVLEPEQL